MQLSQSLLCSVLLAVSALALTALHPVRHAHLHHAIAARAASPAPEDVPFFPEVVKRQNRQNSRRCRPRTTSSTSVAPTTTRPAALNQQPTTTTTPPPPPPTSTTQAAPTTTRAANPPPSGNLPSFMIGTQTGEGTFYDTGLGACGITNRDTDYIAAVSHLLFDNYPGYNGGNPNNNPLCRRKVIARYRGKSVTVEITDRCEGCAVTDLDFSPSAFNQLSDFGAGRITNVQWDWL